MNKKLGHVMSSSRLCAFISFLSGVLAWVLNMPLLWSIAGIALVISAVIYLGERTNKEKFS
ncbi:hypothetical protein [Vibrio sonorensis]|uniref:hypothetical protein n=1 Tax=Vibrio sonorensis TaxID=1004316 RepID=UPI0008D947A5|nr:hypothetical protein [Vibrio sonorensis]